MKATRRNHNRRNRKTKRRGTRYSVARRTRHRGGRLGSIPTGAVFAIQQDPFSAPVFADAESAENIFESRDSYKV
jgi:hypothetical protein